MNISPVAETLPQHPTENSISITRTQEEQNLVDLATRRITTTPTTTTNHLYSKHLTNDLKLAEQIRMIDPSLYQTLIKALSTLPVSVKDKSLTEKDLFDSDLTAHSTAAKYTTFDVEDLGKKSLANLVFICREPYFPAKTDFIIALTEKTLGPIETFNMARSLPLEEERRAPLIAKSIEGLLLLPKELEPYHLIEQGLEELPEGDQKKEFFIKYVDLLLSHNLHFKALESLEHFPELPVLKKKCFKELSKQVKLLLRNKEYEKAINTIKALPSNFPDKETLIIITLHELTSSSRHILAIDLLTTFWKTNSFHTETFSDCKKALISTKNYLEALEALLKIPDDFSSKKDLIFDCCELLINENCYAEAARGILALKGHPRFENLKKKWHEKSALWQKTLLQQKNYISPLSQINDTPSELSSLQSKENFNLCIDGLIESQDFSEVYEAYVVMIEKHPEHTQMILIGIEKLIHNQQLAAALQLLHIFPNPSPEEKTLALSCLKRLVQGDPKGVLLFTQKFFSKYPEEMDEVENVLQNFLDHNYYATAFEWIDLLPKNDPKKEPLQNLVLQNIQNWSLECSQENLYADFFKELRNILANECVKEPFVECGSNRETSLPEETTTNLTISNVKKLYLQFLEDLLKKDPRSLVFKTSREMLHLFNELPRETDLISECLKLFIKYAPKSSLDVYYLLPTTFPNRNHLYELVMFVPKKHFKCPT